MNDLVSVIVPVYNAEKYIENIIKQILNQSYENIELILVNDGSTDNCDEIIKSYLSEKRIKYIYQSNGGPSKARNTGLKYVTGKYLTFIDSDDSIKYDYIEQLYNGITKYNSDICCCGYKYVGVEQSYEHNDFLPTGVIDKDDFVLDIFSGTGGITWGKMYTSEIIINNSIEFNEKFDLCEDQLFLLNAWSVSNSFSSINHNGYIYNGKNEDSIMHNNNFCKWYQQFELVDEIQLILSNNTSNSIASKCLDKKVKNVITNLINIEFSSNAYQLKKCISTNNLVQYVRLIKLNSIIDYLHFWGIKTGNYTFVKLNYYFLKLVNNIKYLLKSL